MSQIYGSCHPPVYLLRSPRCILAEMFTRKPILPGSTDLDQLEKIWSLCGAPTVDTWPDFENLPGLEGIKTFKSRPKTLQSVLGRIEA